MRKIGRSWQFNSDIWECRLCGQKALIKPKEARVKGYQTCKCNQGYPHRSIREANDCNKLHLMARDPKQGIKKIHHEKKFPLHGLQGKLVWNHYPDFLLDMVDGTQKVVETKGNRSRAWLAKKRMFEQEYPDIPYEVW